MTVTEDVVVVGAGPYGLSLAAHLRAAGHDLRQFGHPMQPWRTAMPRGMLLKSERPASNLSDPRRQDTLEAFCREHRLGYAAAAPIPLKTFVAYGSWFQQRHAPFLEERLVVDLHRDDRGFRVTLDDGEQVATRRVVVATGVQHFAHTPRMLAELPPHLVTHTSAHADLRHFRGSRVVVVGAGQSGLESAALLHEAGAEVTLLARRDRLAWNPPPPVARSPLDQLRLPSTPLGPGWPAWIYASQPDLLHRMPAEWRIRTARTALGPAGAYWLRPRVEGRVPVLLGHRVTGGAAADDGVRLDVTAQDGGRRRLEADHVLAATGYRASLHRLTFLDEELRHDIRVAGAAPQVGRDFQSSVPGLYFVGPAVAASFGPVMRFVCGAEFAARTVSAALLAARIHRRSVAPVRRVTAGAGSTGRKAWRR